MADKSDSRSLIAFPSIVIIHLIYYIVRSEIAARNADLEQRRRIVLLAKEQENECKLLSADIESQIISEQSELRSLEKQFRPTRTTLLTLVSSIFPIELLSPPDLLYSILGVPLPIPTGPTDPGPPLTFTSPNYNSNTCSGYVEANEDTIATALGFAAQVVQMLAWYLGKRLVYPLTCVGSRSLIRDGISAMVGPRM